MEHSFQTEHGQSAKCFLNKLDLLAWIMYVTFEHAGGQSFVERGSVYPLLDGHYCKYGAQMEKDANTLSCTGVFIFRQNIMRHYAAIVRKFKFMKPTKTANPSTGMDANDFSFLYLGIFPGPGELCNNSWKLLEQLPYMCSGYTCWGVDHISEFSTYLSQHYQKCYLQDMTNCSWEVNIFFVYPIIWPTLEKSLRTVANGIWQPFEPWFKHLIDHQNHSSIRKNFRPSQEDCTPCLKLLMKNLVLIDLTGWNMNNYHWIDFMLQSFTYVII